jgi:hypothetical protein
MVMSASSGSPASDNPPAKIPLATTVKLLPAISKCCLSDSVRDRNGSCGDGIRRLL